MKHIESTLWAILLLTMSMVMPSTAWADGEHQLTVKAKPAMAGSFNTNTVELAENESIHLYAYANANFTFLRWTDDKGNVVSQQMDFDYTMPDRNVELTAEYEYNPANPANPVRNYWNKELGEVIVDDFTTGSLQNAVKNVIGDSKATDVQMITVAGVLNNNDFGLINTYTACSLLDLSRVTGITQVPSYAFDYTNLESVYLPAAIEAIGYRAFYECKQLSSLIVYAMTPPTLESNVFTGVPEGLVVYVPAAAIAQYQDASGWKDFTILPIQEDIRSITISLPIGTNVQDYAQMWLELTNTKSGQRMHYVMTDREAYTFANIIRNTSWNVTLRNERGDVFGQIDNVEVKDEDVSVTFASLSKPQNVSLSVLTPDGRDVTSQVQVTWTDAKGNYMAQGASLSGLPVGYKANYSMVLPQELAMAYDTPTTANYTVKDGDNNIAQHLSPITRITLSGKVKDATTGLPLSGAVVSASQTFGGKYSKTLNAKTDNNGVFTLNIANVLTSVAFAASDYVSQTVDFNNNEFEGLNEFAVPDVSLKSITGATITLGFTYTSCEGETQNWFSDYQNVNYELFNVTKNRAVSQYNVQYPQIVLLEEIEDGDVLRLTATSRTNAFMPVESTATISEQRAEATFGIVELGQIHSKFTTTGNASVVGSLYDAAGKLVKTYDYGNTSLTISNLTDGFYTLVTMGSSRLFNTIYDLAQLPHTGLVEGTDYVLNTVEVKSGQVSAININEVPSLDESKLYYTGDNTSFTVNKPSIVAGNYLTLTGRIDFKPAYATSVSNVQMIVDLPESCEFVENSVMVGNSTSIYTLNGNRISIPMTRYTDRVRFCIIPTLGGEYVPSAFVQFDLNGETVTQPIGSANYTAKDLSISVPSTVAKTAILVSGTAIGTSSVEIYDNDVLIGQTTSMANGTWTTTCELNEPYNLSTHSIYAKVTTKAGIELQSETVDCRYDMNYIQVSNVHMLYNGYDMLFDFITPSSSSGYYSFVPSRPEFTFLVNFTENDTTKVSNVVVYAKTSANTWVPLQAIFNDKKMCWVASGSFYSSALPVNVSVDFLSKVEPLGDANKAHNALLDFKSAVSTDIELQRLIIELEQTDFQNEELFQELYDYLGIKIDTVISVPSDINQFLSGIELSEVGSIFYDGVAQINGDDNTNIVIKNLLSTDISEEELTRFDIVPLTDNTFFYMHANEGLVEIVFDGHYFSLEMSEQVSSLSRRRSKESVDEFFTKWAQFEATLKALKTIPKFNNKVFEEIAKYQALIKAKENDLELCRKIREAWRLNELSPQQLEQLDIAKLRKSLNSLPNEINILKGAYEAFSRLGVLFKGINALGVINDIHTAISSRKEWNDIINSIESIDCPGMEQLAAKARRYRDLVATGYTTNISTNVTSLVGLDKALATLFVTKAGITGATAATAVSVICMIIDDFQIIQGGLNQWNDIRWKADIRYAIPTLKCPPPDGGNDSGNGSNGGQGEGNSGGNNGGGSNPSNNPDQRFGIDPSGYVYEGVTSNRIEGVTATAYYKEMVEDMYGDLHENIVKWDASEYAQENPLFTDENGMYAWDVPQGLWQVKFEKEGYETTYSEWLPVPPPQLDVNIAMKQNRQPEVKAARAYEDAVEVEFDKYMMPELLTAENIIVMQDGTAVEGTVELLNEEVSYGGETETFASKVRFNAAQPFTEQEVTLLVSNRVKSYAGIRMQDDYQQTFTIEQEIKQIVSDSLTVVGYGEEATLTVSVLPASASKGKMLTVKTSSPMILGVGTEQVVIGDDGKAEITLSGELPGIAALTFSVEGTDKTALTIASVEQIEHAVVASPTANIASGSVVEKGTEIELACETEGATIYYTLDGSCPCDETAQRKVYDGTPIVINESMTIKAMAAKEGMDDSEVATFTYTAVLTGDVNGDGEVNLTDALWIVRHYVGRTPDGFIMNAADIDHSGEVNLSDAQKAVLIFVGKE